MSLWALLRIEIEKVARMKRVYLALVAVSLWAGFFTWAFLRWPKTLTSRAASALGMKVDDLVNGFFYARLGLEFGIPLLLPLFVCLVASWQMAGETQDGTLRTMLTRPVPRPRLLAAKFAATGLYVLALSGFLVALLLGIGISVRGSGPLLAGPTWWNALMDLQVLPEAACPLRFALATVLLALAFLELAACTFCFSCLTRHPSAALVAALMLYFLCLIMGNEPLFQEMDFFRDLRPYLPTRPMEVWQQAFAPEIAWNRVVRDLAQVAAFTATFLGIAVAVTDAKDVTA